jgi:hypothetical protein
MELAKDARWGSAAEMAAALGAPAAPPAAQQASAVPLPLPTKVMPGAPSPAAPVRLSVPVWVVGGMIGLAVVGICIGLLLVFRQEGNERPISPSPIAAANPSMSTPLPNLTPTITPLLLEPTATPVPTPSPFPTPTPFPTPIPLEPTSTPVPTPSPQPVVTFQDDFNGSAINTSVWEADAGSGTILVGNGVLTLSSSGRSYPYLRTIYNPFPASGNFRATFRFRYLQTLTCGVGIIAASYIVPPRLSQEETTNRERAAESSGMAVGVWQDGTYGMQYWLRSGVDREEIQLGINTKWNQTVIEYLDGKYYLYLNGNLIYTSRMIPYRPIHIWIGHPAELSGDCLWSSLEIDYIAVESLP